MKSKTKYKLSETKIVELVKMNFGEDVNVERIRELKGGMFNAAYYIERTKDWDPLVLKVSSPPNSELLTYEHQLMNTEVDVYRRLSVETTIPVPQVLCSDFSKNLIESDYFFMSALKGQSMHRLRRKLRPEHVKYIKGKIGDYFAQLHGIKGDYFGYFTENSDHQFLTWKEAFHHMLRLIVNDGIRLNVKLPYDRIERVMNKQGVLLDAITSPRLVSFDLWPGNIMLIPKGSGYEVEGLIDFERSFWGDPHADFPPAFLLFKDVRDEPELWSSYVARRKDNKVLTPEDLKRIELYRLYIFLIMSVETYRYGFLYGKLQYRYAMQMVNTCLKRLEF